MANKKKMEKKPPQRGKSAKNGKRPPPKPKRQREPYSVLIPFLVVLLVLIGIFDLALGFYIWLNRDRIKGSSRLEGPPALVEPFTRPERPTVPL